MWIEHLLLYHPDHNMQKKHRLIAALLALSMTYWNVIGVSATVSPTYGTVTNSTATFYLCSDVSCPSISILIPSGVMATSSSVTQMAQDRIKQFGDILRNTTQNSISWTTSGSTISDFALIQGTQQTSLNSVTVPFYVNTYASDSDKLNSGFSTNTNGIMMRSTIYGILAGVADTTNTSNYTQIESAVSYYSSLYVTYSTSSSTISAIDNPTKKRLYDNVF